jgi:hypothetical protein
MRNRLISTLFRQVRYAASSFEKHTEFALAAGIHFTYRVVGTEEKRLLFFVYVHAGWSCTARILFSGLLSLVITLQ